MKFGNKLYELRKKNGYSQEELADKLGVSRQSVSKWESNSTYPETDKIIQIANLFDCSMDDLINDKITDIEGSLRINKIDSKNIWDSFLNFITDTVTMFSKMSFSQGFKCIIELIILGLLLGLLGNIVCGIASSVIANIFHFLSDNTIHIIKETLNSLFNLVWFVVAIIIMVHTFKLRYLNNYQDTIKEEKERIEKVPKDDNISQSKIKNKEERDKPFEFLSALAKIVIFFIKFIAFFLLLGFVCASIGLIVVTVLDIAFIPVHIIFLWGLFLLVGLSVIFVQIVILLVSFIFNKKMKILPHVVVFIIGLIVIGISIGLIALTASKFDIIRDNNNLKLETQSIELKYKDNLVIDSAIGFDNYKYKYVIDNSISDGDIIVSRDIDSRYFKLTTQDTEEDNLPVIQIFEENKNTIKFIENEIINNLKHNKIYTYEDLDNEPIVIKGNEKTINNLIYNLKKLYLIEEHKKDNEITIVTHGDKVYFKYGLIGEYDATKDIIKYEDDDSNYKCIKQIEATSYGERIVYICDYEEDE